MNLAKKVYRVREKRFKFENAWLCEPGCKKVVSDAWDMAVGLDVQMKLEICGEQLMRWGESLTKSFKNRLDACKCEMKVLRGFTD